MQYNIKHSLHPVRGKMNEIIYKPLTPDLRNKINSSIDTSIEELKTCNMNGIVYAQITSKTMLKKIINSLPDGYLLPFTK